jgi:hypothetical protein
MEPKGSLLCSQEPAIGPVPKPYVTPINKLFFFFYFELLALTLLQSRRTTPYLPSATAYSSYSHLPSISGGRPMPWWHGPT